MQHRDVFICHASEDKDAVVRPMVEACEEAGITCWHDEAQIKWGDSITARVNEGLAVSRFVVVVFSETFLEKNWPQRELHAVLNMEASTGEVKVLPIIVGSDETQMRILAKYPLLNDKRYLPWDGDLRKIVASLLHRLQRGQAVGGESPTASVRRNVGLRIPLPRINRQFTQRDRDLFLRESFDAVKDYFKKGLLELEGAYQEVQTDFMEVHHYKFVATVYIRGEVANRCKIWLGGMMSTDAIAYQSGQFTIESDNSFNDLLQVADDGQTLGFGPSSMMQSVLGQSSEKSLSAQEAAGYLWHRFTNDLG